MWDLLTNKNTVENYATTETDSDENIEGNKNKRKRVQFQQTRRNVSNISANEVGNIALVEQAFIQALFSVAVLPKRFSFLTVCLVQWLRGMAPW